jgi:hypothetical protein
MRRAVLVLAFLAECLVPSFSLGDDTCVSSGQALPLCVVLANAPQYDGKEITVAGIYHKVIHGSILTASACPGADKRVNMRSAPNWKTNKNAAKALNSLTGKHRPAEVVLRGIFRVAKQGCFGQTCSLYEIEETELLCATPTKTSSSVGGP